MRACLTRLEVAGRRSALSNSSLSSGFSCNEALDALKLSFTDIMCLTLYFCTFAAREQFETDLNSFLQPLGCGGGGSSFFRIMNFSISNCNYNKSM